MFELQDITTDASDYENPGLTIVQAVNAYTGPGSLSYSIAAGGVLTYSGGPGGTSMTDLVVPLLPVDDSDFEYTESVEIFLTNPSSSTGGTVTVDPAQSSWTISILDNDGTALDRYVAKPDASYEYSLVDTIVGNGLTTYVIDMTSQTWRSMAEVDKPEWQHWVQVIVPDNAVSDTAILLVGAGNNGAAPTQPDSTAAELAQQTNQITIHLPTVPNQPLVFTDDGISRREDQIMAYTFDKFLDGGDEEWPVLLPMVKSAIRAMDTAQEFLADNTAHVVDDFFVTGGSKRGWATYLTAATDPRVTGIVPVVFDYLNIEPAMAYHQHIYDGVTEGTVGGYAEALSSYVEFDVFARLGTPEMDALRGMIDPYEYRDRLTLPKYAVMSSGDQFMPMLSQFYINDLPGPTYLRYIPNTGHGGPSRASGKEFFAVLDAGATLPVFDWSVEGASENVIRLNSTDTPVEVNLWQATNPDSLDFRINYFGPGWTSTPLLDQGGGEYVGSVPVPATGGTAFFVEMKYNVGGEILTFTTESRIVEATFPLSSTVTGRHLFYNQSTFDNNTAGVDPTDSAAIATDKAAYLPGGGTISSSSMSSYSRGINGLFIDLTGPHGTLSLADFGFAVSEQGTGANNSPSTRSSAPAPTAFTVLSDTPVVGTDRVEFIWADNTIEKRYLEVTTKGNDVGGGFNTNTGLAASDYFYYGSQVADDFLGTTVSTFLTSAADEISARNNPGFLLPITNIYDYNKDSLVTAADQIFARTNAGFQFRINIAGPPPPAPVAAPGASPARAVDDDGTGSAVASALTIPNTSRRLDTSSSVPTRWSGIEPGGSVIAGSLQLLEEPDGLRAVALSKAADDVAFDFSLDEPLLELLAGERD